MTGWVGSRKTSLSVCNVSNTRSSQLSLSAHQYQRWKTHANALQADSMFVVWEVFPLCFSNSHWDSLYSYLNRLHKYLSARPPFLYVSFLFPSSVLLKQDHFVLFINLHLLFLFQADTPPLTLLSLLLLCHLLPSPFLPSSFNGRSFLFIIYGEPLRCIAVGSSRRELFL